MSELKALWIPTRSGNSLHCYLKSEADKVIADLEDKLRAANKQIENLINSASSIMLFQDRVNDNKCDELSHQKYKRCLAMASKCRLRARWFGDNAFYKKEQWALQWHKRWIKIAEQFKESK